jgi:xylan 1,4-beta-xylosidase
MAMKFQIKKDVKTHKFNQHWKFCVGSGHATLALRTDYARILKMVHDELGIERVRFHGIFNDDMKILSDLSVMVPSPISETFKEQSFQQIGVAYDNVLDVGMKPFVELGFMQGKLASGDTQLQFFYGGNVTLPKDYEEWGRFLTDFIHFLQHRYGEEEVRSWYFEVWNEPDLGFFGGGLPEYLELYEHTARVVKAVDPEIRIGGPATSGSKWVRQFVRYCREHDVPVDFVSTHQYAGDPLSGIKADGSPEEEDGQLSSEGTRAAQEIGQPVSEGTEAPQGEGRTASEGTARPWVEDGQLSPEEMQARMEEFGRQVMARMTAIPEEERTYLKGWRAVMEDETEVRELTNTTLRKNSAIVKRQADGLPLYYTEWNMSAVFGAYSLDTRKAASYNVKAVLDTEEIMDGSSLWCFSDIFEEQHWFPEEFHGGFGMVTHSGIPKPTFYGFKMLSQLAENRMELGEGATDGEIGIAAFEDERVKQVLLFRQKMKQMDLPKERATVSVELEHGPLHVSMQRIDEEHCNPLKLWEEMGAPQDLNRAEAKLLKKRSEMVMEAIEYDYVDGVLQFSVDLAVNDIYLITIELG